MTNEEKILDILASMQGSMQAMDQRLSGRLDSIDTRLDAMDARFDRVDERLDAMDARFDAVDNRLDAMDARFDAMDERFDGVDNRLTKLEFKIETDVEVKLDALGDGHAAILEQMTPRTRIDDMENELRFLKNIVYRMSDELQQLKKAQ